MMNINSSKIKAQLIEDNIIVWDIEKSRELYKNGFYGKPLGIQKPKTSDFNAPLILDLIEAIYLVEKNILEIYQEDKKLTIEELMDYGKKNYESFLAKYYVYKDLRNKGFIVTPGIKFGSDFAVYKYGPGIDHAPFIVQVKKDEEKISALEIVRSGRLATTVKKHFTLAIPNISTGEIDYLIFSWFKP